VSLCFASSKGLQRNIRVFGSCGFNLPQSDIINHSSIQNKDIQLLQRYSSFSTKTACHLHNQLLYTDSSSSMTPPKRRSERIRALSANSVDSEETKSEIATRTRVSKKRKTKISTPNSTSATSKKRDETVKKSIKGATATRKSRRQSKIKGAKTKSKKASPTQEEEHLPRAREEELMKLHCASDEKNNIAKNTNLHVIGVDEAGRGPLAGPVVAAAVILPSKIAGITDSKKLTKEETRESLYEKVISSPDVRWSVAVGDAKRIDDINILQTTLECMSNAVRGVVEFTLNDEHSTVYGEGGEFMVYKRENEVSSKLTGCYIVCGRNDEEGKPITTPTKIKTINEQKKADGMYYNYYALIDGNRTPTKMICPSEFMIKGDSREYSIGAASILAKVTRDRLMHEYDELYPAYDLKQHKGYPTKSHMAKVFVFGASPIHRRTFAPLKHMSFDMDGKIIVKDEN